MRTASLGELTRVVGGTTPRTDDPANWDGGIVWVTPVDLGRLADAVITTSARRITAAARVGSGLDLIPAGSVVMSSRAPIGHLGIAAVDLCTNQGCKSFIPGPDIDGAYLFFLLRHRMDEIRAMGSGATFAEVSKSDLQGFVVSIPAIEDQRRIASNLECQLDAASRALAGAHQRLATAVRLRSEMVDATFRRPVVVAAERTSIASIVRVQSGYAFRSDWFRDNGVRLLRNANIGHRVVDWSDVVRLDPTMEQEFAEYRLAEGDLVLSLDRPIISTGLKVARLSKADVPSLLLQRVARLQPSNSIDAAYLYFYLQTAEFIASISGHEQSLGVPHVSPRQVGWVQIPLPEIGMQRRLVADLHERLKAVDVVVKHARAQLEATVALPATILRAAIDTVPA